MNSVVLIGRLARDPELRFVPASGMAVARITLAVDKDLFGEKKQQAVAQGKQTCDFINITVFGKMAESAANYLSKGSKCAVKGRINTGSYKKEDGTTIYTTDVLADKVEFLDSKQQEQTQPQNSNYVNDDDEDIFEPVDDSDMDSIPF